MAEISRRTNSLFFEADTDVPASKAIHFYLKVSFPKRRVCPIIVPFINSHSVSKGLFLAKRAPRGTILQTILVFCGAAGL